MNTAVVTSVHSLKITDLNGKQAGKESGPDGWDAP